MAVGGIGIISVVANIVPGDVAALCKAFDTGDMKKAQEIHYKLLPLIKAMFYETNPVPVKTTMGLLGMCDPEIRLPLCKMSENNLARLKTALTNYELLK